MAEFAKYIGVEEGKLFALPFEEFLSLVRDEGCTLDGDGIHAPDNEEEPCELEF